MVAERAGVQRHTLYAHFPDERSVFLACSGHVYERDPMPDGEPWRAIEDRRERLRTGLRAIYRWYERNASLLACVLRDGDHPLVREVQTLRAAPVRATWQEVLGAGLTTTQRPVFGLALSFYTWRTLVRDGGLTTDAAVDTMLQAIDCAR
jgi:AcrR family transcriptional regulator